MRKPMLTLFICFCFVVINSFLVKPVFASAWVSSHFVAKKIDLLQDGSPVITAYPIINLLSGPGTHTFDSFTQLVMTQGKHKLTFHIIHEQTGKTYASANFELTATYDGYTHNQLAHWEYASKEPGWYRFEMVSAEGTKGPQVINTFFFYQYPGDDKH